MRLGKIILQACAVVIALALIGYGYVAYRQYDVWEYERETLERFQFTSLADALSSLAAAPAMRCVESHSDFNSASHAVFYHAKNMTRIDYTDVTALTEQHWIALGSELYVWTDTTPYVLRIDAQEAASVSELGDILPSLFVDAECEVWWRYNPAAFEVPTDKPVIGYDELR